MGTYTRGVYVPDVGEQGWGEEVDDFLAHQRAVINVMLAPYGAVGDGVTDDSGAIQAALDDAAAESAEGPIVFFPRPPAFYGIGTPLEPSATTALIGESMWGTTLKCMGGNHSIFSSAGSLNGAVVAHLRFEDSGGATPTDYCFDNINLTAGRVAYCTIYGFKGAVNFTNSSSVQGISTWYDHVNFSQSALIWNGCDYANNIHFNACSFQSQTQQAVNTITMVPDNAPQSVTFQDCYWETHKRSLLQILAPKGLYIAGGYIEGANTDGATYTTQDGVSRKIPVFDIIATSAADGGNTDVTIDGTFLTPSFAGDVPIIGTTIMTDGLSRKHNLFRFTGRAYDPQYSAKAFDTSWFLNVDMPGRYPYSNYTGSKYKVFTSTGSWSSNTMPAWDLNDTQFFQLQGSGGVSKTLTAPTHPRVGVEITFMFDNTDGNWTGATLTWPSGYALASSLSVPTSGKRSTIKFMYVDTAAKWIETSRAENA